MATATGYVLAKGLLTGWGQPNSNTVPLYGPHWNPGAHRDLELLNVETGEIHTALKVDAVKTAYPDWFAKSFGGKPASIFFPILSPDLTRVFFKMATAGNGDPRSKEASARQGLVCYSLARQQFLFLRPEWGHPSWHPDKKTIVESWLPTHRQRQRSRPPATRIAVAPGEIIPPPVPMAN